MACHYESMWIKWPNILPTGRRSSPVPQLTCVGGSAAGKFRPAVVQVPVLTAILCSIESEIDLLRLILCLHTITPLCLLAKLVILSNIGFVWLCWRPEHISQNCSLRRPLWVSDIALIITYLAPRASLETIRRQLSCGPGSYWVPSFNPNTLTLKESGKKAGLSFRILT